MAILTILCVFNIIIGAKIVQTHRTLGIIMMSVHITVPITVVIHDIFNLFVI